MQNQRLLHKKQRVSFNMISVSHFRLYGADVWFTTQPDEMRNIDAECIITAKLNHNLVAMCNCLIVLAIMPSIAIQRTALD